MVKILSDIQFSGSRGNITFGHNRGGQYQRTRAVPVNPNSTRQQAVRTILGTLAAAWYSLTSVQRAAWNSYAALNPVTDRLGQSITLSGMNWFMKCNSRLSDAGITTINLPPVAAAPAGLTSFTATFTAANAVSVVFTPVLPADACIQLWQTLPGSAASSPNFNQARLVGYSAQDQVTPWAATLQFTAQIGDGCTLFAAVLSAEGLLSAHQAHSTVRAV